MKTLLHRLCLSCLSCLSCLNRLNPFLPLILIFSSWSPVFAQSKPITDSQATMEKALDGVRDINDLLENPDRLNRYYEAVNDYYQSKIKRDIFDIVLQQIQVLSRENPEVGIRLLRENTGKKPYTVVSDVKTYGRNLNPEAWDSYVNKLFVRPDSLQENPATALQKISEQITSFEKNLHGNKRDQGLQRAEFYKKLKQDHEAFAKKVVGSVFHTDPAIQNLMRSQDPDLILFGVETLLKERLARQGFPDNTLSLLSSFTPRASDLMADKNLFPVATTLNKRGLPVPVEPLSSTTYEFKSFKRPLHAVWKGLWLGECVGGRDNSVTPRRWATVILDKVHNYAVEKNGSFVGFIQEIGIQKPGHHAIYYATEFGTPNLKEHMLVLDPETKLPQKRKMIDVWLEKAPKNIVRVKSSSNAINNAGVWESLNTSPSWNLRVSKGKASDFQLADQKFADFVIDLSNSNKMGDNSMYGRGMISDTTVPTAQDIDVMKNVKWTPETFVKFLSKKSTSSRTLILMIENNKALVNQIGLEQVLSQMHRVDAPGSLAKMTEIVFFKQKSQLSTDILEIMKRHPGSSKALARGIELEMQKNAEYSEVLRSLINMTIQHHLVEAYPSVAQYQARLWKEDPTRDKFINILAQEDSSQRELVIKTLQELMRDMLILGAENQLKIYKIAEKHQWTAEFRKNIPLESHTLVNHTLKHDVLAPLARDAIRSGDVAFIKMILKAELGGIKSNRSEMNTYTTIVTEIMKRMDPNFYELLGADVLQGFKASVQRNNLSPEAQIWYDILDRELAHSDQIAQEILKSPEYQSYRNAYGPSMEARKNSPKFCSKVFLF